MACFVQNNKLFQLYITLTGIHQWAISVTHQHPLQTAKIVTLSPPVHHFLEADSVAQLYELLTNVYSLGETSVLKEVCIQDEKQNKQKQR